MLVHFTMVFYAMRFVNSYFKIGVGTLGDKKCFVLSNNIYLSVIYSVTSKISFDCGESCSLSMCN